MSRIYRASQRLRPRNKFLHSVLAGCGFAVVVVGLIALTNFAASRMEKASAARSDAQTAAIAALQPEATAQTGMTPKSKLSSVPFDKNSKTNSSGSATADPDSTHASCNASARQGIISAFTSLINSENTVHQHNLSSIISAVQKTSLFTQILNPGMLNSKISTENQRHQQAIKALTAKEIGQLTAIHCNSH